MIRVFLSHTYTDVSVMHVSHLCDANDVCKQILTFCTVSVATSYYRAVTYDITCAYTSVVKLQIACMAKYEDLSHLRYQA